MDFGDFTFKEVLLTLFSGIGVTFLGLFIKKKYISKNTVIQKDNTVVGDIAGRDIHKK